LVNTFQPSQPYATWWKKRNKLNATPHQVWFGQYFSTFSAFCTGTSLMPPSTRFGWSIFFNLLSLMQPDERKETNLTPPTTRFGLVNTFQPSHPYATWWKKRNKLNATHHQVWFGQYFSTFSPLCNLMKEKEQINATQQPGLVWSILFNLLSLMQPDERKRNKLNATPHQVWFGQYFSTFSALCNLMKEKEQTERHPPASLVWQVFERGIYISERKVGGGGGGGGGIWKGG
jgi:hypothetical protein